jgi:hypothetical protein
VSKSGTNSTEGAFFGNFRDDALNASDAFTNSVLPYSNQQVGGALGGPIVANRLHYFASYEYEREPNTVTINPSGLGGSQIMTMPTEFRSHNLLGRVDEQLGSDHITVRGMFFDRVNLHDQLATNDYPARGAHTVRQSGSATVTWARPLSPTLMQEVKGGYFRFHYANYNIEGVDETPEYNFPGIIIGPRWNYPNPTQSPTWNVSYNLAWHRGSHDLKIGAEYRDGQDSQYWPARSRGRMFFSARPPDMARRFPLDAWNDASRWDLSGLDSLALRFDIAYSGDFNSTLRRPTHAVWLGDTWEASDRLTLNLGVRYDLPWGDLDPEGVRETDVVINTGQSTTNVGFRDNLRDTNNIAPRVGFTWRPTSSTDFVVRGGTGLFYGGIDTQVPANQYKRNGQREVEMSYVYDGRPGWVADPTRGITAEDVLSGRIPSNLPLVIAPIAHDFEMPYTWQTVVGFQKQLTNVMGFDADLVFHRGYSEFSGPRDPNLFFDPATGFPRHPNRFGRPNPQYGLIDRYESYGRSEYLALPMSFTRRYHRNFQAALTYTPMFFKNDLGAWVNPFDLEQSWGRAADFQRHTFRANGIWHLPADVTLAGSFRFGSGNYATPNSGVNPLGIGGTRLRSDLSIVPRSTFKEDSHQSLDLRVAKALRLGNGMRVNLIAEVFNLYNHDRYSYNLIEGSPTFGRPTGSAGDPRSGQLAFRFSW